MPGSRAISRSLLFAEDDGPVRARAVCEAIDLPITPSFVNHRARATGTSTTSATADRTSSHFPPSPNPLVL
jgi:hypothetical protein